MEELGNGYVEKGRKNQITRAISDVKLSELARTINPDIAAENLFVQPTPSTLPTPIASARQPFPTGVTDDKVMVSHKLFLDAFYNKDDYKYLTFNGGNYFQNLNLKKFIENLPETAKTEKFKTDIINQWLLATHLGILDMHNCNNIMITHDTVTKEYNVIPQFDFECGNKILDKSTAFVSNIHPKIAMFAHQAMDNPIHKNNIEFLQTDETAKTVAHEFLERAHIVKTNNMGEIFDLQKIQPIISKYMGLKPDKYFQITERHIIDAHTSEIKVKSVLGNLGDMACKGYCDRFNRIAEEITK